MSDVVDLAAHRRSLDRRDPSHAPEFVREMVESGRKKLIVIVLDYEQDDDGEVSCVRYYGDMRNGEVTFVAANLTADALGR